jgi:hypothetical protein
MDGMGTEDSSVGRIIVYASETDLVEVNDAHKQKYEKTLVERVAVSCSKSLRLQHHLPGILSHSDEPMYFFPL